MEILLHTDTGFDESASCLLNERVNVSASCEEGFGSGSDNFTETRLIPSKEFACNGTIVGWTVSGRTGQGTQPPKLQLWRQTNTAGSGNEYYYRQGPAIPIDPTQANGVKCEEIASGCVQTFWCRLHESYQITVRPEVDIVGIELPPLKDQSFELIFVQGAINSQYIWLQDELGIAMAANASLEIGSEDAIVDDILLLHLNVSTGKYITGYHPSPTLAKRHYTSVVPVWSCRYQRVYVQ